jgi:hypothetical protein
MNRREFVVGAGTLISASVSLTTNALGKEKITPSPLFNMDVESIPALLRAAYKNDGMSFILERVRHDNSYKCSSLLDAEKKYIAMCPSFDIIKSVDPKADIFNIKRASNQIALDTLRGRARHLMANSKTLQRLYKLEFMMNEHFERYERNWMPNDVVFVFYAGSSDYDRAGLFDGSRVYLNGGKDIATKYGCLMRL